MARAGFKRTVRRMRHRAARRAAPRKDGELSGLSGRSQTGPRAADSRPYGGKRTGRVGSGTQAQERDRPSSHFPKTQAPSGAGWNRTQALLILRAGNPLPSERGDPRKWGF